MVEVHIYDSKICLEKAIKSKALNRAFKIEVPNEVYEGLMKEIGENE